MGRFKTGDKVVMHTCIEANKYSGKIWTCQTGSYVNKAGQEVVFLNGFSGYFFTEYLAFVDLKETEMIKMLERVNETILNDSSASIEQIKLRQEIELLIKQATEL